MPRKVTRRTRRRDALNSDRVRTSILAAAARVFGQRGIVGVRVEDLLAATKISRRTFYRYFESKEEVVVALYDLATGKLVETMRGALLSPDPFHEAADVYVEFHRAGARHGLLELGALAASRRAWLENELVALFERALKKQGQRKVDAYQLRAMFGGLDALGRTPESDRAREASHAFVDRLLAE
jgi:AcrR family transcriptional regulator